jgi:beta-lactam-binding protein with PASTA domain
MSRRPFVKVVYGRRVESTVLRKKKGERFPDAADRLRQMGWNVPANDARGMLSKELEVDGNAIMFAVLEEE